MKSARPTRKLDLTVKVIGGETLLYNGNEKAIHILNPTAKLIWDLCDGEHMLEDMEQEVRASFSIAEERDVAGDIRRTLEVFADKGLLENSV
jgi:hypothetical protein